MFILSVGIILLPLFPVLALISVPFWVLAFIVWSRADYDRVRAVEPRIEPAHVEYPPGIDPRGAQYTRPPGDPRDRVRFD